MLNKIAGMCCVALALTGCADDAAVGEWEHEDNDSKRKDTLSVFDDGTGERTLALRDTVDDGTSVHIDIRWDIDWEESGEEEYDTELDCKDASIRFGGELVFTGCDQVASALEANFSLEAECSIKKDGEELECQTEGAESKDTYEKVE